MKLTLRPNLLAISVIISISNPSGVFPSFWSVSNGEIDAVVVDSTVADGFVAKNPDKYEKAFSDKTEPEEFGIAIGKNNAKLQEAINKALEQMDKDGFLKDTADYWFSSQE